jgi:hypothetical protein
MYFIEHVHFVCSVCDGNATADVYITCPIHVCVRTLTSTCKCKPAVQYVKYNEMWRKGKIQGVPKLVTQN